jgi:predicted transcriptional regulator
VTLLGVVGTSVLLGVLAVVTTVTLDDDPEGPLEEFPRGNSNAKIFIIEAALSKVQIEYQMETKSR